ncbi:GNAT family N-acetyltransferase [Roseobacter sp. S98]|uniref:GNAT family N-acetyltransferase n=1 Tax=Roseobacter algicola (ex Choi et al. 2025) (nom. illeg.) TaxID=3092138 RepID=UPI0035C6E70D
MTRHFTIDPCEALLDRPVWNALMSRLSDISIPAGSARMMHEDTSPLAAAASGSQIDMQEFAAMVAHKGAPVLTLERETPVCPLLQGPKERVGGVQMIAVRPATPKDRYRIHELGPDDAAEMFDLAARTKPGPFERNTHTMGDFIGIRRAGHLVAMAGQRLKLPGYTEISAVCVDSGHRGCGMAADLIRHMCQRIIAEGDVPFLHTYANNRTAIELYEHLGFEIRTQMEVALW